MLNLEIDGSKYENQLLKVTEMKSPDDTQQQSKIGSVNQYMCILVETKFWFGISTGISNEHVKRNAHQLINKFIMVTNYFHAEYSKFNKLVSNLSLSCFFWARENLAQNLVALEKYL